MSRRKSRKQYTMPAWLACVKYGIPQTTFYRAINKGLIPCKVEYVARRRVRLKDVRTWMDAHWKRRPKHPKATNVLLKKLRPVTVRQRRVLAAMPRDARGYFAKRSDGQTTMV